MPPPGLPLLRPVEAPAPPEALLRAHAPGEPVLFLDACPHPAQGAAEQQLREWSFLALDPSAAVCARGEAAWTWTRGGGWTRVSGPAWATVRAFARDGPRLAPGTSAPPFPGGVAGFVAYDAARHLERLPTLAAADTPIADALLFRFEAALAWNHGTGDALLAGARAEALDALETRLARARPALAPGAGAVEDAKPSLTREEFEGRVLQAREFVRAGDVYQVNLSHRFTTSAPRDGRALYLALREANAAPFATYLASGPLPAGLPAFEILSSSPERLFSARGRRLEARPIAGTRPRGTTPEEDARLATELRRDEKEVAEHVMLVDLARNDLGRVSRYGSVRVEDLLTVETYRRVHHLVSGVSGQLREGLDALDAFEALFPGGTITGVPKVRAMEIIEALEPVRRGAYTGGIGYFGAAGDADWNILIRTLTSIEGKLHLQAGAGIVWDSEPGREYAETLAKARALFEALAAARERAAEASA